MNGERKKKTLALYEKGHEEFQTIRAEELSEILIKNLNQVILVIFSKSYSGESRMLYASISELSQEYNNSVRFIHINADENPEYIERQGIHLLPTLLIYTKSEIVYEGSGLHSKSNLRQQIKKYLQQN